MNNESLMRFNTWIAEQPELFDLGYVGSRNDHENGRTVVWWVGPDTAAQERVTAEARARGIEIVVHPAKYSRATLNGSVRLVSAAKERLAAVDFEVASISTVDLKHDGLRVQGYVAASPDSPLDQSTVDAVVGVLAEVPGLTDLISLADIRVEHGRVWLAC